MQPQATLLIAARQAAATIGRALRSALTQGDCRVVLVDDFSTDDTVAIARSIATSRLTVLRPPERRTLGLVRQTGLQAVTTPYALWLDADDELLSGRVQRLVDALETSGADFAADEAEVRVGATGESCHPLAIPGFIRRDPAGVRLLERNYLPGIGVVAFRSARGQSLGYDTRLNGSEDVDFVLRAVAGGARFAFIDVPGYRIWPRPDSLSRNRANQRAMYRRCLLKHSFSRIRALYLAAGYDERVALWALVSVATFREEYPVALDFVARLHTTLPDPQVILEPDGPCTLPEGWRIAFHRGTLMLLTQQAPRSAARELERARALCPNPETLNNLGVALARIGDTATARTLFQQALDLLPDYVDARMNVQAEPPAYLTTHPLRQYAYRSDYTS